MKRLFSLISICFLLSACTDAPIKAPCPNFGALCHKTPINVWDYPHA